MAMGWHRPWAIGRGRKGGRLLHWKGGRRGGSWGRISLGPEEQKQQLLINPSIRLGPAVRRRRLAGMRMGRETRDSPANHWPRFGWIRGGEASHARKLFVIFLGENRLRDKRDQGLMDAVASSSSRAGRQSGWAMKGTDSRAFYDESEQRRVGSGSCKGIEGRKWLPPQLRFYCCCPRAGGRAATALVSLSRRLALTVSSQHILVKFISPDIVEGVPISHRSECLMEGGEVYLEAESRGSALG
jgi:hypothetical protein